jgi:hypothetical protein
MLIGEFNSRFASDEGVLFEALREVSRLEPQQLLASDVMKWDEWPPDDCDDDDCPPPPNLRFTARADA